MPPNAAYATMFILRRSSLKKWMRPPTAVYVFCNPPYGERLETGRDLGAFYKRLGDVLKQRFKGWTAFVLSGNKELAQLHRAEIVPAVSGL